MINIDAEDNNHIYVTRGDNLVLDLKIPEGEGFHVFKPTDIIKFGIYEEKGFDRPAILLKEFEAVEESDTFRISISSLDMKIGELINTRKKFWYEIQLNNNQTLVGYNLEKDEETGTMIKKPAILTLLPEGSDSL